MVQDMLPPEQSPEEIMFQQAVEAIHQEQFARARDILTKLLRTDQNNPDYWVWMSAAMETQKERLYCLQTAFKMDPTNSAARRGLILMGALLPDDTVQPFPMNHPRPWESKIKLADEKPKVTGIKRFTSNPAYRLGAVIGIVAICFVAVFVGASILIARRPAATQVAMGTARPTVTPYATNSNQTGAQATVAKPLAELLDATYTPTAIYAATPHAEAAGDSYKAAMRAYRSGQWDTVVTMMEQVATAQPGSADTVYFMGEARRLSGDNQDAINYYKMAIDINANFAPSYLGRARANLSINSKKNVLDDLNKAISLDPNYAEAYMERGLYYARKNDFESAKADLKQAAQINDSPLVEINLARILLATKENDTALEAAKRANQMDVTMVESYLVLGMAYRAKGQIDQAVDVLETYLKYQPDNAEAFAVLGAAYYNRGDYTTAEKNLMQAVRLDKTNSEAYFWLGETYLEQKDYDSALSNFQSSIRYNSNSFNAGEGTAKAYMGKGEYNNSYIAIIKTEGFIQDDDERARFLYIRALSLDQLSQPDAAYRDWNAILALPVDATTDEMRQKAQARVVELRSATPVQGTTTPTKTPIPTQAAATRQPSKTPASTATRAGTNTPSVITTPSVTPTPSATPTP
jgi:tetratricopeptide (TPR) repeat protein